MLLNISLALAMTGGVMMQSVLNNGRQGTWGSNLAAGGMVIAFAALIAAFFVMTWWWVLIGLIGVAAIGGKLMIMLRENSLIAGVLFILASVVMLIVYFAIR